MRAILLALPLSVVALIGAGAAECSYSSGYTRGCLNGSVYAGSPVPDMDPDATKMADDADYARGYREGVRQCYIDTLNTMGGRLGGGGGGR
ncbi:MAG: hypothetical protein ACYC1L_12430 [Alphaproteobacteria bacterium]